MNRHCIGLLLSLGAVGVGTGLVMAQASGRGQAQSPQQLWAASCAYCHETDPVGPPLLGAGLPVDAIRFFVRSGTDNMPAFHRSELSDSELTALAEFIAHSEKPKQSERTKQQRPRKAH